MNKIKGLFVLLTFILVPFSGVALADDCFDTVIGANGETYYIDPGYKYSLIKGKERLISTYGNSIDCTRETKEYSLEEYFASEEYIKYINNNKKFGKFKTSYGVLGFIFTILYCIALWKVFVKAGKRGIQSLIPIYNWYKMSEIAGLSGGFKKAFISCIAGTVIYFFSQTLGALLLIPFGIYMLIVKYNIARNFGWSTIASILYVIFNKIAVIILGFGNYEYDIRGQRNRLEKEKMNMKIEELVNQQMQNKENTNPIINNNPTINSNPYVNTNPNINTNPNVNTNSNINPYTNLNTNQNINITQNNTVTNNPTTVETNDKNFNNMG